MSEIKTIVSRYLSKAEKISGLDLSSSFHNIRKAVEAIADDLYSDQPKEFISVMRKLKNLRNLEKITKDICKGLITIVAETNKHCHHNPNSKPDREVYEHTVSKLSDIFFTIYDDYVGISDDYDVKFMNQKSIQETEVNLSENVEISKIDDDLLTDVMFQAQTSISEHEYELAEKYATFSLEGFIKSKNEVNICNCRLLLSDIYIVQNKLSLSAQFAELGYNSAKELGLSREKGWGLQNLGIIHEKTNDYERARYFFTRALDAYTKIDIGKVELAKIQNSLAMNYLDHPSSKDFEKAEILLKKAYKNIEGHPLPTLRGSLLACISFVEEKKENYPLSLELAYEARGFYRMGGVDSQLQKRLDKKIKFLRKRVKRSR